MSWDIKQVQDVIDRQSTLIYPTSFGDIASAFKEKYGDGNWTRELAKAAFGTSPQDKYQFPRGSTEYKAAEKAYKSDQRNIQRWADGTRNFDRAKTANKAGIEKAGQTLPPIRRETSSLTITVKGQSPSDKTHHSREREFTATFTGNEAAIFANDPNWEDLFDEWFDDAWDVCGEDSDYELTQVEVY